MLSWRLMSLAAGVCPGPSGICHLDKKGSTGQVRPNPVCFKEPKSSPVAIVSGEPEGRQTSTPAPQPSPGICTHITSGNLANKATCFTPSCSRDWALYAGVTAAGVSCRGVPVLAGKASSSGMARSGTLP